jgi:hypothetical protein
MPQPPEESRKLRKKKRNQKRKKQLTLIWVDFSEKKNIEQRNGSFWAARGCSFKKIRD